MIRRTQLRRGATLVEVMVAGAMCVLMMWLFAWCFQQGTEAFRNAKAQSDLKDQEQMVVAVMTRDLRADHFEEEDGKPDSTRVRGQRLDRMALVTVQAGPPPEQRVMGYTPPRAGYFWARSRLTDGAANILEGVDGDSFQSSRSTDHALQFTSILPGGPSHLIFNAELPFGTGTVYSGRAAEIGYFLVFSGKTTPGGVRLYNLIRWQKVVALNDDYVASYQPAITAATAAADTPSDVMVAAVTPPPAAPAPARIRTLRELTVPNPGFALIPPSTPPAPPGPGFPAVPSYRLPTVGQTGLATTSLRYGEDVLMSNVTSFEVKFTGTAGPALGVVWPTAFPANSDYPYDTLPHNGEFDTFSNLSPNWNLQTTTGPLAMPATPNGGLKCIRATGVMIRIRAFETRTNAARQTTFIVDL